MGAVSFIYNLELKSLTIDKKEDSSLKSIDKSKDFLGNLLHQVKTRSASAIDKAETFFFSKKSTQEEDYNLQLALALSASLEESRNISHGTNSE